MNKASPQVLQYLTTKLHGLSYREYGKHQPSIRYDRNEFINRHSTHLARSIQSVYFCIYFSSGRSCSYSSVRPPGGGCCTVCNYLAFEKVTFSLRKFSSLFNTGMCKHNNLVPDNLVHSYMHGTKMESRIQQNIVLYWCFHLDDFYEFTGLILIIAKTFFFSVQVHSQDKEPNKKVTGRIMLLLHVIFLVCKLIDVMCFYCAQCILSNINSSDI